MPPYVFMFFKQALLLPSCSMVRTPAAISHLKSLPNEHECDGKKKVLNEKMHFFEFRRLKKNSVSIESNFKYHRFWKTTSSNWNSKFQVN